MLKWKHSATVLYQLYPICWNFFCSFFETVAEIFSMANMFGREPGLQIRAFQSYGTGRNSAPGNTRGRPVRPLHDQPTKRRPTNDTSPMKKFL